MHAIKRKHFERDHPGETYPAVDPLPSAEAASFAQRLATLKTRVFASDPIPGLDSNLPTFRLNDVWPLTGIDPADELLLSFDAIRSIDRMRREDVERYFEDVWYPASDDLFIFDGSVSWLVFVLHEGDVYVAIR